MTTRVGKYFRFIYLDHRADAAKAFTAMEMVVYEAEGDTVVADVPIENGKRKFTFTFQHPKPRKMTVYPDYLILEVGEYQVEATPATAPHLFPN